MFRAQPTSRHVYTEHLRIPVGTGSLHVERTGRGGPPILLVHGFGSCAFLWRAVAPQLATKGFTVLAVDLLGHGESDSPDDAAYDLGAQADYLERVLTALRLPATAVVGQDIGALVALVLAARRPSLVARLALLSPPDPNELPGAEIRGLQRMSARVALGANAFFGALLLLQPLLQAAVADPTHMPPLLVARYLAPFVGSDGVSRLLHLASAVDLSNDDLTRLRDVSCPITLVFGEANDPDERDKIRERIVALALAGARVVTVPGAGRLLAEDTPVELVRLMTDWMGDPPTAVAAEAKSRLSDSQSPD